MLEATGLCMWRGTTCLFTDLSFRVPSGVALLVSGPNGSGKTTLLRIIAGLTQAEQGQLSWEGLAVGTGLAAPTGGIAYLGHLTGLKADLSPRQNLTFAARLAGLPAESWEGAADELGLADCLDLEVRVLSAGQKRRTALARLLTCPSRLWVLDEPLTNLDTQGQGLVRARLEAHLAGGGTAVVAAHHELDLAGAEVRRLQLGAP